MSLQMYVGSLFWWDNIKFLRAARHPKAVYTQKFHPKNKKLQLFQALMNYLSKFWPSTT